MTERTRKRKAPDDSTNNTTCSDQADLTITVKHTGQIHTFEVVKSVLSLASPVWKAMLEGSFAESTQKALELVGDHPKMLSVAFQIAHFNFEGLPKSLSVAELQGLATLCDKYRITRVIEPLAKANEWIPLQSKLDESLDTLDNLLRSSFRTQDIHLRLHWAWVFKDRALLSECVFRIALEVQRHNDQVVLCGKKLNLEEECLHGYVHRVRQELLSKVLSSLTKSVISEISSGYDCRSSTIFDSEDEDRILSCSGKLAACILQDSIRNGVLHGALLEGDVRYTIISLKTLHAVLDECRDVGMLECNNTYKCWNVMHQTIKESFKREVLKVQKDVLLWAPERVKVHFGLE